jgi:copper(I)-binding protein
MVSTRLTLAVALLLGAAGPAVRAHQVSQGDLALAHPFIRLDPRCKADVTRAHVMLIVNSGAKPDRLIGAELDQAGKGRLVRLAGVDGKAERQVLGGIEIPANGNVALMPPEWVIEFPKSRRALSEGGATKGTLSFERTGKVAVTFMVDAAHEGQGTAGCPVAEAAAGKPHKH